MDRRSFVKSSALLGAASLAGIIKPSDAFASVKGPRKTGTAKPSGKPVLRFKDGEFRILQLTDTHLIYDRPEEYAKTFARIENVVAEEKPSFLALTGDNVTGEGPTRKAMWNKYLGFLDGFGIPYCVVYGNHDAEAGMSRPEMSSWVVSGRNCVNTLDPVSGELADVRLPVYGADGSVKLELYFLDSHDYSSSNGFGGRVPGYAWFKPEQVAWLKRECESSVAENGGVHIPSMAFFHIPLVEYDTAWNKSKFRCGVMGESVCSGEINSGMFLAMLEGGNIMGVFSGHDHNNNYITDHYGIALAYGGFSGDNTTYTDLKHSLRVIIAKEGRREFDTWLHDEYGNRICKVAYSNGEFKNY